MKEISIQNFINNLKIDIPPEKEFLKLSRISPINPKRHENSIINFERGMLLYALITKIKPKTVLEIGTAEGYSTLCMAWAMTENKIEGKIFTVDPKSHQQAIERRIKINENDEPINMILSTEELWNKFASQEWIDKIEVITGYSGEVLRSKQFPEIEFCYIDGSHVYEAVKHDFYAFLQTASENFSLLFDDYTTNENKDVAKVIHEEIVPNFDVTLIRTNAKQQRKGIGESNIKKYHDRIIQPATDLYICWMESRSLKKPLREIYSKSKSDQIISKYLKWEKRWKLRKTLNTKIPLLGKFRFSLTKST